MPDASGNATTEGSLTYGWNAESQLKSAAGVNYLYDGDGRRVSKSNGKLYWFGAGSEILAETDGSGNTLNEYVFFGGKRVALLPAGSTAQFYVEDSLGTSRVVTNNTGGVCYDADFYPFGGERTYTNSCTQNNYKFEGKERDTETGNDDFGARYYSNRFGRWLSADWSSVPVAVPYANLSNPQTLNLYSMVADDPESFADLDGHKDPEPAQQPQGTNSVVQFTEDEAIGMAKELANTVISVTNLVDDVINATLSTVDLNPNFHTQEFKPSTPGEKEAMLGTAAALLIVPESKAAEVGKAGEVLSRLGTSRESAARLARKAEEAEKTIGIHGVSATAREVTGEVSRAARSAVESVFKVHDTPTKADPLHRTIELAKPVTRAVADAFNSLFGRTP